MPAMTRLLNGQAVKVRLASTSVTLMRASSAFSARAQLAPPNPPPITTTRPAAPWASAGIGNKAAAAAADFMTSRRVSRRAIRLVSVMTSILLRRQEGGDGLGLVVGETFGDAIHHGRGPLAGAELGHGGRDLGGVTAAAKGQMKRQIKTRTWIMDHLAFHAANNPAGTQVRRFADRDSSADR